MIKKILYLPIETLFRELDSNLLLAGEALRQGFSIVLGESDEVKAFARHVGGGAYIYKHWESKFPYRFDAPERRSFYYAGLHQEGVVWIDDDTFLRRITERGRSELLDVNFVKGERQRALLAEFYPAITPVLQVSGSPTFDILRQEFRPLFRDKVAKLQKRWGPYVLVDTNFSQGNRRKHDTEDLLAEREKSSIKNVGRPLTQEEKEIILGGIAFKQKLFEEYRDLLVAVSKEFPHINFILRPHPSENHDTWREALKGLPNVHVVFKDNVVNWILGAAAVVHTGCTTALEAWTVGKPVIRYNPLGKSSPYESELPNLFGVYAASVQNFVWELRQIVEGNESRALRGEKATLKAYVDSIDGELSAVRIMNRITSSGEFDGPYDLDLSRRAYLTPKRICKMLLKLGASWLLRYDKITKYILGEREAVRRAAPFQKFPGLSASALKKGLTVVAKVRNNQSPGTLRVKRADVTTFVVERL